MRKKAFDAMMKQEIGFFDDPSNSTGALCSRLSGDAGAMQGATGTRLGTIVQSIFTLVISVGLAMYYEWKLGLVTSCFMPLLLVGIYFQMKVVMGQDMMETSSLADAAKV